MNMDDYTEDDGDFDLDGYMEDLAAEKADRWIKEKKEEGRWPNYLGLGPSGERKQPA